MADETPNGNLALAVGELKGSMSGIKTILENQDKASSEFRTQMAATFKDIQANTAKQADLLAQHIKEDAEIKSAVLQLVTWKADSEKKIETLWDTNNKQTGFFDASKIMGGALWGAISGAVVVGINYFLTGKAHQ